MLLTGIILFASCSSTRKSSSSTAQPVDLTEAPDSNNTFEVNSSNSEHLGSGSSKIIFNGSNNEVVYEFINSLFNANESHIVILIDGSNNIVKLSVKESIVNASPQRDTIEIKGNYNSLEFIREFVIENDNTSDKFELNGNLVFESYSSHDEVETFDSTQIANKFTKFYEPAFEVIKYYTSEADSGNLDAHYYLGEIYLSGVGAKKDLTKSKFHLFAAAQAGHVNAMYLMGHVYEFKDHNTKEALKWYYQAADHGHIEAINRIEVIEATDENNDQMDK